MITTKAKAFHFDFAFIWLFTNGIMTEAQK